MDEIKQQISKGAWHLTTSREEYGERHNEKQSLNGKKQLSMKCWITFGKSYDRTGENRWIEW